MRKILSFLLLLSALLTSVASAQDMGPCPALSTPESMPAQISCELLDRDALSALANMLLKNKEGMSMVENEGQHGLILQSTTPVHQKLNVRIFNAGSLRESRPHILYNIWLVDCASLSSCKGAPRFSWEVIELTAEGRGSFRNRIVRH